MGFVVVSHQHAGHVSLLPSLLSKCTAMSVVEAADGMHVEADRVYLAPGGTNLAILHGALHLMEPPSQERVPLPIDYFFRSLAEDGRASVLSTPSVIAINGKKSRIDVADQIPITTSVLQSNTNPPVTTTTVEYRDVGVILSFTPFINDFGLVTLEIDQEVSDVTSVSAGSGQNPTFFKRKISTTLVASQDQSIVLGGLVKERRNLDRSGLPFFYKIPIIGWIFGQRDESVTRNELLIFITPRVIRSVEEGVRFSKDFEERVAELKARVAETRGIRLKATPVLPVPNAAQGIPAATPPPKAQ